jgi:hypothetical protein
MRVMKWGRYGSVERDLQALILCGGTKLSHVFRDRGASHQLPGGIPTTVAALSLAMVDIKKPERDRHGHHPQDAEAVIVTCVAAPSDGNNRKSETGNTRRQACLPHIYRPAVVWIGRSGVRPA